MLCLCTEWRNRTIKDFVAACSHGAARGNTEPMLWWSDRWQVYFLDPMGTDDVDYTDEQIHQLTAMMILDNGLAIAMVAFISSNKVPRRTRQVVEAIDSCLALHDDMRNNFVYVSTAGLSEQQVQDAYGSGHEEGLAKLQVFVAPWDEQKGYTFKPADFIALMRDPVNPEPIELQCSQCGVKGDPRTIDSTCRVHNYTLPHDIEVVDTVTTTVDAHHAGPFNHRGHFQGWFHGNTFSICGCHRDMPCCTCHAPNCGQPRNKAPFCVPTVTTTTGGNKRCTREGSADACPGLDKPYCIKQCANTACGKGPETKGCVINPSGHNWTRAADQ